MSTSRVLSLSPSLGELLKRYWQQFLREKYRNFQQISQLMQLLDEECSEYW